MLDAVTESGTVYRLDLEGRQWMRCPQGRPCTGYGVESLWSLKVGTSLTFPWESKEDWQDARYPEVGKHLYVASRDVWFVSTKIVRLVEVEGWDSEVSGSNN